MTKRSDCGRHISSLRVRDAASPGISSRNCDREAQFVRRPLRVRWKFSVARAVGVPIGLRGDREADCPSTPVISKHLAVFFHALQYRFGSVGKVRNRFGDLGYRHRLTGKRQFTQDHFAYRPAPPLPFVARELIPLMQKQGTDYEEAALM